MDEMHARLARPKRGLAHFAVDRHHELERACLDLVKDPSRWSEVEQLLRDHMLAEEELIIPAFQLTDPEEADQLRTQHAQIRALIDEINTHIQRNGVHRERLRRLQAALRAHATREDAELYPWAEHHLPVLARRQLMLRISHWLRRLAAKQ